MEANEAPEKLYFGEFDKGGLAAYSNKESNDEIEYTRTDAFIDKACKWLKSKGGFTIGFPSAEIKDFKNYMKGE